MEQAPKSKKQNMNEHDTFFWKNLKQCSWTFGYNGTTFLAPLCVKWSSVPGYVGSDCASFAPPTEGPHKVLDLRKQDEKNEMLSCSSF